MSTSWQVLLADDHTLVREGFRALLSALDYVEIVGEVAEGTEAVRRACAPGVNLVLMDLEMPGIDGIEATRRIKAARGSNVHVVMLTAHEDRRSIVAALQAGASGYLSKSASLDEIERALKSLETDGLYVTPALAGRALAPVPDIEPAVAVTRREHEVILLLAEGLTARSIAARLGISERTVNSHVGNVYRHFGVNNRVDALREAMKRGLVDLPT